MYNNKDCICRAVLFRLGATIYHMVEISMMAMMLNCVREHVYITKIAYAMQCS